MYESPGTLRNVTVLVSVATIESRSDQVGSSCPPRKYSRLFFCPRPSQIPSRIVATKYATTMRASNDPITTELDASNPTHSSHSVPGDAANSAA